MWQKRREMILNEVNSAGRVKVTQLSRMMNCSEVTIRNDIKALQKEGLLKRTHGGAVCLEEPKEKRKHSVENIYRNERQKKQIAVRAYEYIEDGDAIILDDSSSAYYLACYIKVHPQKRINVVTNAVSIATELVDCRHVDVFLVGGFVGGYLAATMGEMVVETIRKLKVDKAFIGVHSVNFEIGLTSMATPQIEIKKAILETAGRVYVLADGSKFGGGYVSVICPIDEVEKIITDPSISNEYIIEARKRNIPLEVSE